MLIGSRKLWWSRVLGGVVFGGFIIRDHSNATHFAERWNLRLIVAWKFWRNSPKTNLCIHWVGVIYSDLWRSKVWEGDFHGFKLSDLHLLGAGTSNFSWRFRKKIWDFKKVNLANSGPLSLVHRIFFEPCSSGDHLLKVNPIYEPKLDS